MSYQVFCQVFAAGTWKWTGKEPAGVGMQLDAAFRAFAAAVNANPANATTPLSVIRSHADATANRWGFTWRLGHPTDPGQIWFTTESLTAQGDTQSSSSAQFGYAKASTFSDTTSNGGYGSYSNSTVFSTALAYLDTTTSYTNVGAILLIAHDTTPGAEFFCWALKTFGGNEDLHRDSCHAVYKSPGTTGWHSIAIFPKTAKQFYGQTVLLGYTGEQFTSFSAPFSSAIPTGSQQLRSRMTLGFFESTLEAQGLLNTPPPLVQLPPQLFIGSTSLIGPTTHFGKVTFPDGVMLQLGQRSTDRDVWLWVPSGTSHNQSSPWTSALGLSQWRESNELNFVVGGPAGDMQFLPASPDFIRNFPHMSAVGARQHPQQGPLLSSSGGGGGGSGGGDGETGGGPTRPSTGLLWPRGI
ncbi:MAG: hypothetical protein ACNA8O_12400 [Cyanobacteriota bacterium]